MSIQDYEEARLMIEKSDEADFEGEKDLKLIEAAENALALKFPPSYRRFLSELGCGDIGGEEFYGIIDDNFVASSVPNGIWLTLDERKCNNLSHDFILIYGDGSDGYCAIDTSSKSEDGENQVVRLSIDNSKSEFVASSFGTFLKEIVSLVV